MKLTKLLYNNINKLIKSRKSDNELEARITKNINKFEMEAVLNGLIFSKKNNGLGLNYTQISELDITNDKDNTRITVIGEDSIKLYWLKNNLLEEGIVYKTEIKERLSNIEITDYGVRLSLSVEKKGGDIKELMNQGTDKNFRYKNRYKITSSDGLFSFDLTIVKMATGKSFRDSNLFRQPFTYEIEMEYIGGDKPSSKDIFNSLLVNMNILLKLYQGSTLLIREEEKNIIIDGYNKLIDVSNRNKGHFEFIAANPVTLHVKHLLEEHTPNIMESYAVTDKADGLRNLLYVYENGECYLIDNNKNIMKCNINIKSWKNSLIEGEYISELNTFLVYDMLFEKGNDIRSKSLYISETDVGSSNKSRLNYLSEFMKGLDNKGSMIIMEKKYLFGKGDSIFKKAKMIWSMERNYKIDGLIFIPYNSPYPLSGRTWTKLLKWKPNDLNSIDFLVKVVKNDKGEDKRSPYIYEGTSSGLNKVVQYKSLELFVGGLKDVVNKNNGNWTKQIYPIPFNPPNSGTNVNIANILLDDRGRMMCKDPLSDRYYVLEDNMIVEFVWEKDDVFYWKPLRIREDKTEKYLKGEPVFGNSEMVANDNWLSIQNPVTLNMITTGVIPESSIKKALEPKPSENKKNNSGTRNENKYYKNTDINQFNYEDRMPFQRFHNIVVKRNLIKEVSQTGSSLLDLACGKGGDLPKWKDGKFKKVVGIDNDKSGLEYAENFYKKYNNKDKPQVDFIWGDSGLLIFPGYEAALDEQSREKMMLAIPEKHMFNVVSLQFALHYFFKDEKTLRTLLQNVSDNLDKNGYFIGTCFDGNKIMKLLKKKDKIEGKIDDSVIWSIEKNKINGRANYGNSINVFVKSIGSPKTEYIVKLDFFEKICKEYGLEKVGIHSFEKYYKESKNNVVKDMTDVEKEFSFLNSTFVFKKTKEANKSVSNKLLKLLKKPENVDAKVENEIISIEVSKAKPEDEIKEIKLDDVVVEKPKKKKIVRKKKTK
jgi:hypothetical protein